MMTTSHGLITNFSHNHKSLKPETTSLKHSLVQMKLGKSSLKVLRSVLTTCVAVTATYQKIFVTEGTYFDYIFE